MTFLNNGVDLDYFSPGSYPNPFGDKDVAIVMTGRMDYRPNYAGAIWCASKVGPQLFAKLPNAHLYFVGANPPPALKKLSGSRVTVTGAVEDVRPYIQHAAAVIAPLQIARGVQNKVLEAMAMQKAVVASDQASRALAVKDKVHLWIANEPEQFAAAIVQAVDSPQRDTIRANARRFVEDHMTGKRSLPSLTNS